MAYAHKGPNSDVFVHADLEGIKCLNCALCLPNRSDVVLETSAEMLAHLEGHRTQGHAVPEAAMERLAAEARIERPKPKTLEPEMQQVILGAMLAFDGQLRSLLLHGRGFARIIIANIGPGDSEAHRQAVENAREVLGQFNEDGSLKPEAEDDATVIASMVTLRDQAEDLLAPPNVAILRSAARRTKPALAETVALVLRSVPGVEAAFLNGKAIYVVAREHGMIDRQALLDVEEKLARWEIEIHVRAHQGRDLDSLGLGSRLV